MAVVLLPSILPLAADGSFFSDFLQAYTPRRLCMNSEPAVIWLSVLSDALIALSYFSIPLALVLLVRRRRDLAFDWMFLLFASFIFACGATHVMGIWAIWQPLYKLDGTIKLATGLLSAGTAVLLWRLIPTLVSLPSPSDLAQANATLSQLRDELEQRVELRTRELAEAGERERAARADAVRANRAKDEFLATLSHELRNPLAPVRVAAAMLRELDSGDPHQQELHEIIDRQTRQLSRLLDDLLDVGRITSGKIVLRRSRVALDTVLASAMESSRPLIESFGHDLTVRIPQDLGEADADPARLAQVFTNLLNNAAKFTPQGGRISLSAAKEDGHAVVRVRDTGIGLSPDQIDRIFEMFAQVETSLEREYGGLGVGLALARQLVQLHGGRIEAHSEGLGRGSEFVVKLPLARGPSPSASSTSEAQAPTARCARILIADDNVDSAETLAMALRYAGHEVRVVHDGAGALEAASTFRPDWGVLDIGMPKMNGYDVARRLRSQFGTSIRLVAMTGWGQDDDKQRAKDAGFDHHMTKPADLRALMQLIADARSNPRSGDRHEGT